MSYLDSEIYRIERYIEGLGIKLVKYTKKNEEGDFAQWAPNEIDIYVYTHKTKINLILTMLHEIGHQIHYMHNQRPEVPDEVMLPVETLTKAQRKKILDYERPGIQLMPTIAVELNLKIPMWKVYLQSELDLYMYETLYELGRYPTAKELKLKRQVLTKIYKGKKYE